MKAKASTPREYLASLDPERKKAIQAIRKVINDNIDKRVKEVMTYGMLGWVVPHSVYPDGYHCDPKTPLPFANLASQKNHIGIYLFCIYGNPKAIARFEKAWKATGKKLDMGKSCIRIKKLEDLPMDVLADALREMTVDDFIAHYESNVMSNTARKQKAGKKTAAKKKASKKTAKKATSKKKPARKKPAAKKAPARKKTTKKKATKKAATRKTTAKKKATRKVAKKTTARKKAGTTRKR